ncbi:TlpA disulfide reductase family protein [uncultured Algibacter sp.]|uniref:TlpA family protein disulfide reductase n=1 Tax=uncultured Algibacter sp. TaxID=298659 RepID=UPI0026106814|nr:TlpA disulfide reductase family protein [uncultured Algibacter sp.]
MKKIFILFSLITITLMSCNQKESTPVDYVILSGKITNNTMDMLRLTNYGRLVRLNIDVDEDGVFLDTLKLKKGRYNLEDPTRIPLYLENGYNLVLNFDEKDVNNTLAFSGKGSAINNYTFHKKAIERTAIHSDPKKFFSSDETQYKENLAKIKADKLALLGSYKDIPKDYVTKEKRSIDYEYLFTLGLYESSYRYYAKDKDYQVSEGFLKDLEKLDYTNAEDLLFSEVYLRMARRHCRKMAQEQMSKNDTLDYNIAYIKSILANPNQEAKNVLLFKFAELEFRPFSKNDLKTLYTMYMENCTNEAYNKEITEKYNEVIVTAKGQPSPKFVNYENYAGGTTSLDDLKGKYVYIDVWASWCGPCKAEIPHLKEIEKTYHDKNIVFVGLSIDKLKDRPKWRKIVKDKALDGIQLLADKDWKSSFIQKYDISGIPRFILIDPNGNIVDGKAPYPSQKEVLTKLFDELLTTH